MKLTRSHTAILALLMAAVLFGQSLQGRLGGSDALAFEDIDGLPGWRRVDFDQVSAVGGDATGAVFLGIGEDDAGTLSAEALCRHLFPGTGAGVPAAFFTDVNCPNCRSLAAKLDARADRLRLNRLELPILGPVSETHARVMTAARLAGGAELMRLADRFQRGITVNGRLLTELEKAGIDPEDFLALTQSAEVDAALRLDRAAANTLGVYGTPGLVVGRTLVMGDMPGEVLDALIAQEAERDSAGC